MAIVLKDRVKQSASAPGTGTITLGATAAGFQAFSAIGNGNVTYFAIVDPVSGDWEVNYGTYTLSGTTLTRNATPLSSSNAGALVNFTGTTLEVFCTYPSSKAIYEETGGNVLIDGGPITVIGSGVTTYSTFAAALGEMYANINSFAQFYAQNVNNGSSASTDIVAYNDLGDGSTNFIDMGISSSNYTDATYPIFTPGSGYVYNDGGELIIGSATDDVLLFAGGVATTDWAARIDKTTKALTTKADVNVGGALDVTGAAVFGSTVLLDANPTLALQAATKQYVDNQVTAGLHIHAPVRVETTGNLTAAYAQGGTTFNITTITSGTTVTTSANHGLSIGDQIWLYSTAGNGLSTNVAYFVFSTPALNTLTLSLTYGGAQITGLTNASGLTYATRANSGVGATLTNSGAQAALSLDSIALSAGDRVMVRLQTNGAENGVYTVTTVGSGSTNWVLTRATDSDTVNPADPDGVGTGDYYFTQEGIINAGDSHVLTTEPNTMIIGYTPLTYTQFSGSVDYVGGTNISIVGQTISLTGTVAATNGGTGTATVTTGDILYGSATDTWSKLPKGAGYRSLLMNAGGTQIEWNAVALNQSNAVSGTLDETNGGTGINAYTLGDTVYASAANTLSALAGNTTTTKKFLVQTGTGAASAAPVWGTVSGSDVSGNITGSAGSVANALTLGTYLTGTSYNGSSAVTATVDATSANTASKVVARDASGNFSAGTITATLNGTATSTASATNLSGGAANQVVYQSGSGTTAFATAPSASNQVLNWNGSAFTWSAGTISGVALGSNLNNHTPGTYLTGSAYNGSSAQTWAVDATSANTVSKVVARDASGNFSAGTITASLSGNATTATSAGSATTASNVAGTVSNSIQSAYQTSINTTTPGLALYGVHFNGQTTADYASGITWNGGTTTTNANAGIYVQGSGAYGTKMYIATTDSYAVGSKTAISIDHTGLTNFVRVRPTALGNTILDAGNYGSYALPLSGGTLTGALTLSGNNYADFGPNTTWGATLRVGGNGHGGTGRASVVTTNGNLHLDGTAGSGVYLNWYTTSTSGTFFGNGASGQVGRVDASGNASFSGTITSSGSITTSGAFIRGVAGAGWLSGNFPSVETGATTGAIYSIGGAYYPTSTSLNNMYGIGYANTFTGGLSPATWGLYVASAGNVKLFFDADGGIGYALSSFRAPIFYDYNNTSYYVDPSSTSTLNNVELIGGLSNVNAGTRLVNPGGGAYVTSGGTINGAIKIRLPVGWTSTMLRFTVKVYTYDTLAFEVTCGGYNYGGGYWVNNFAFMDTMSRPALNVRFAYDGSYNCIFIGELGSSWSYPQVFITDVQLGFSSYAASTWDDGWSVGFETSTFGTVNETIAVYPPTSTTNNTNPAYASIYYDAANTGYYVNANDVSYLYGLELAGGTYFRPRNWIQLDGAYGLYWPNHYGAHFKPNTSSTYTQLMIQGNKNAYGGLYDLYSDVNVAMYDSSGNGGAYREASGRWYFYYNVSSDCMGIGTSSTSSTYSLYLNKGVYAQSRIDATIYYEVNNTGYYFDPAGPTGMRTYGDWRADDTGWTGEFSGKIQYHAGYWYLQAANGWFFRNSGGSTTMFVDSSGNLTATGNVTAYSDARIKENIVTIDSALDKVLNLRGVYYNKIGNPERCTGVIAQEVLEILPEVVRSVSDTNPSTGETTELLAVDYGNITGLLIEAVKQLSAKVEELQKKV